MHPVERADGVVILGEILNEDVVPAYVSVAATLAVKEPIADRDEGSFDKISHLLLPKQVTPFLIKISKCFALQRRQRSDDAYVSPDRSLGGPRDRDRKRAVASGPGRFVDRAAHQSKRPDRERRPCSWNLLQPGWPGGLGRGRVYRHRALATEPGSV